MTIAALFAILLPLRFHAHETVSLVGRPDGLRPALLHVPRGGIVRRPHPVLFVHGATFPSVLSFAYPFDGLSWMDELADAGFDVWALDFIGYGKADRFPEMQDPADAHPPLGRAPDASTQIAQAVSFIQARKRTRISIVAHSWGTIPAALFGRPTRARSIDS